MDEAWERAVEAALEGDLEPRALTLDGAVKCLGGRLPPSNLLERFRYLENLSIANVGVASLDQFPRLPRLQRLSLSDNRIAGGLEYLVAAGLDSLRDLDLSNNRIQSLNDLAPLSRLRLMSLDLYECPVTRIEDYRSRVFSMIRSLKYLDKMDADGNERPESDEEDDEEDEEEEEENEDEDDPGCGEIDGEDHHFKKIAVNGSTVATGGGGSSSVPVDVDDDEDSEADDNGRVETNGSKRVPNGYNGFRVAAVGQYVDGEDVDDEEEVEEEEDDVEDLGVEIDEEEGEDDEVVEVHEIDDSYEDEEEVDGDVEEEDEFEEDVEDEEEGDPVGGADRNQIGDGEIDGHERGEGDEDENGEIGEEDDHGQDLDRDLQEDDEEEDLGTEYLVQPIAQHEDNEEGSDFDAGEEEDNGDEEDGVDDEEEAGPSTSSSPKKRKRKGGLDDSTDLEDLRHPKQR